MGAEDFNNPLPFLPEELIIIILLRLPVRSLLRFKCVCKSWKTLISDTQFANNHFSISNAYPQLVLISTAYPQLAVESGIPYRTSKIKTYPIESLLKNSSTPVLPVSSTVHQQYKILGSCNGFLCLYDADRRCVQLWNPSINLKSKSSQTFDRFITYYGFGYDQINHKYKLLAGFNDFARKNKTIIYTFGENSCKNVKDFPRYPRKCLGKFVSGTLNWIVGERDGRATILSFNIEKETYRQVLLPQHGYAVYSPGLYVLSNCICVCTSFIHSRWQLWMMKEYGVAESWTKLMSIPHENLLISNISLWRRVEPLFISENGVVLLMNRVSSQLILYNLNNRGLYFPRILGGAESDLRIYHSEPKLKLHIYHESLLLPQC